MGSPTTSEISTTGIGGIIAILCFLVRTGPINVLLKGDDIIKNAGLVEVFISYLINPLNKENIDNFIIVFDDNDLNDSECDNIICNMFEKMNVTNEVVNNNNNINNNNINDNKNDFTLVPLR